MANEFSNASDLAVHAVSTLRSIFDSLQEERKQHRLSALLAGTAKWVALRSGTTSSGPVLPIKAALNLKSHSEVVQNVQIQ